METVTGANGDAKSVGVCQVKWVWGWDCDGLGGAVETAPMCGRLKGAGAQSGRRGRPGPRQSQGSHMQGRGGEENSQKLNRGCV